MRNSFSSFIISSDKKWTESCIVLLVVVFSKFCPVSPNPPRVECVPGHSLRNCSILYFDVYLFASLDEDLSLGLGLSLESDLFCLSELIRPPLS